MSHLNFLAQLRSSLSSIQNALGCREFFRDEIAVTGLYFFALFSMFSISPPTIGFALMVLAFITSITAWKAVAEQPIFWLCITLIIYITLRGVIAGNEFPSTSDLQLKWGKNWSFLFLFFIVSWWLSRNPKRIPITLGLALMGFTLGIILSPDFSSMVTLDTKHVRSGMHYRKPVIFGFHCLVVLLGLLIFAPYWLDRSKRHSTWIRVALYFGTGMVILFFLNGLIISESRGVWLAAIIVIPIIGYLFYRPRLIAKNIGKIHIFSSLIVALLIVLIIGSNWNLIRDRLNYENQAFHSVIERGLDNTAPTDSTYRLYMWRFGIKKWLERPLFGWGPGTTQFLVGKESHPGLYHPSGEPWDHLHSGYIEMLLQLGMVGTFLATLIIALLVKGIYGTYRSGQTSKAHFFFFIGNLALIAIYSLTDFRHLHWNWQFYWILISGIAFANFFDSERSHCLAESLPHRD